LAEITDKALVRAHLAGDCEAFARIVRRYGPPILGYLTKMTGRKEQAEDLFQETFKRLHEKAHTFRGDSLRPWLYRIATNLAISDFRKRKPAVPLNHSADCPDSRAQLLVAVPADKSSEPSHQAQLAEQAQQVRDAIDELPDRQKATLLLAYYQQLNYTQIARVLDCSVGTVKTQMFRALKTLARKLPDPSGVTQ